MKRVMLLLLVVSGGFMTDANGQQQTQSAPEPLQQPSFRAGVDVVSLTVTVTDSDGRFLADLDQEEFLVYEDGVQQDVDVLLSRPASDRSCSAHGHQRQHGRTHGDGAGSGESGSRVV